MLPFFFFNDTATTEIYTLSLHDALPIYSREVDWDAADKKTGLQRALHIARGFFWALLLKRSEEHTSELQSRLHLVCRLLLEKKCISKHFQGKKETMHRSVKHYLKEKHRH